MSRRVIILLVGVLASGLALLGRFGRLFENWDARLLSQLSLPGGYGVFPIWLEAICVLLFAFGTALVGVEITGSNSSKWRVGLILAIILQPISALAVGSLAGTYVSPFAYLAAILVALFGVVGYRFSAAGKRERQIRQIFGNHLSAVSLAQMAHLPDALAPKTTLATVLSARYLGHDGAEVEAAAQRLRAASAWVEVQAGHRLLAVWNLPLELGAAAEKAVATSLELGRDWQVGVATGTASGELLPATQQWQMRGAAFEKADALYQANATFGSQILLDLATADLVRETVILRPVDFLILPAAEIGVEVFEPLALTRLASQEAVAQRDSFWEAVIFFRQKRFHEALAAFQKSGDDAVVRYYRKRLEK